MLPKDAARLLETQRTEVLIAGLVVLITLAFTLLFRVLLAPKGRSRGNVIVLAGPCNSGKTALFLQLRDGSTHNGTVASMQENSSSVKVVGAKGRPVGSVTVLDVPGHERLRHKLEQHLKDAAAVIFVVDAVDVTPHKVC
jgi:signal recognition particle receptor subunit beta